MNGFIYKNTVLIKFKKCDKIEDKITKNNIFSENSLLKLVKTPVIMFFCFESLQRCKNFKKFCTHI